MLQRCMIRGAAVLGIAISIGMMVCVIGRAVETAPGIRFEPFAFATRGGQEVPGAELGWLSVPEDADAPAGRTIALAMVRLPSTAERPGYPIVYLAGGPGDSGIGSARGPRFALLDRLREFGDVIALDQRGAGLSEPDLECVGAIDLPFDRALGEEERIARYRAAIESCGAAIRERGIDLAQYHTNASADDLERLRKALGVDKLRLVGVSYGTHLALAALRRYPDSFERVVLAGIEGPDATLKLPSEQDAHVSSISAMIAADPIAGAVLPDFEGLLRDVLASLEAEPAIERVLDPATGEEVDLAIGAFDIRLLAAAAIPRRETIAYIPYLFVPMAHGDFSAVAPYVAGMRRDDVSMMQLAMDAASAASPERLARIATERTTSLLGTILDTPFPDLLDAVGVPKLPDEFRKPLRSSVPTYFLSGTLDGPTPITSAEEVRRGFDRSEHLVVEGAGHDDTLLVGSPEILDAIAMFFGGGSPLPTRVTLDPIEFVLPAKSSSDESQQDLAIVHATVIDGTDAPPFDDATILVRGNRIVRVGPASGVAVPDTARVIDATGRFVIPGLWDMHVHICKMRRPALPLFVRYGVTGVRDMGGELAEIRRWQREIAAGRLVGPQVLTAGSYLEAAANVERMLRENVVEPVERSRIGVRDPEHAREAVRELVRARVDYVKMRTFPDKATYFALAEEASAAGLPFVGHAHGLTPDDILRSGQLAIEHGLLPTLVSHPAEERAASFRAMAQRGVVVVPTLAAWEYSICVPLDEARRVVEGESAGRHGLRPYTSAFTISDWREQFDERVGAPIKAFLALRPQIEDDLRAMREAGMSVLPGSDTAVMLLQPGASLHDELELLVARLGMSPAEVLRAATRDSAAFVGLDTEVGTIAPRMRADLVILGANPLDDIRNTRRIEGVVLGGRFLDRAALDALLEDVARMPEIESNDWMRPERLAATPDQED